jgi:tape measure domain-containing protein
MATSNRDREVKMTLSVETLGSDDIKKLQTEIQALGKNAGDASPEFDRLADEIGRLGAQADVLRNFQALGAEVDQLAARQAEAATQTQKLKDELTELGTTTATAAAAQAKAQAEYAQADAALKSLSGQLTILRNSYDANGKRVENYKAELERLTRAKVEQKAAVDQAKAALDQSNKTLGEAEAAEGRKAAAVERSQKAVEAANKSLAEQQRVVDAAAKELEALGLSSTNVAQAQAQLVQALNAAGSAANNTAAQLKEMSAAADFERQATEAQKLVRSAEYVRFWEQALQEAEVAQKEVAATATFDKQAADAQRLVQASEYVRFWEQALKEAEQAQREVAATADFNRQLAEAKQLREAADYVRFWEQALQEADAAQVQAAQSIGALNRAFSTINLRGVQEVETELRQVREAMQTIQTQSGLTGSALTAAMRQGQQRVNELERELRQLNGTLTLTDKAAGLFKNSMGQIAAGNLIADGIGAIVERLKEAAREFVVVNVQAETMRRALNAIYKDSGTAAKQFDFLRATASAAGISISGISDSFVKFAAATKTSNIPLEQTNALFQAVTQAGATLGLSTERVQLALDALGQIASKGTVSMEELRQQLGDSLPGALSLTAKGLGITDAELIKLVESGRLASRDFFPALTKGLKELQGDTDGLTQTWARFKNVFTTTAQGIGDAGFTNLLSAALKILGGVIGAVAVAVATLGEKMFLAGKAAIVFFEALRGEGTRALQWFSEEVEKSDKRIQQMRDTFDAFLDPAGEAAGRLRESAVAAQEAGAAAQEAGNKIQVTAAQLQASAAASLKNAEGSQAVAVANRIMGDASLDAGAKFTQLGVRLVELQQQQEAAIVVAGKGVKAAKEQGDAITTLAGIRGTETDSINASVRANELMILASDKEFQARQALAASLAAELKAKTDLAIAQDGSIEKRKTELAEIEKRLGKAQAEADVAARELEGLRATSAALEVKRKSMQDNGAAADELRDKLAKATEQLEVMREAERLGLVTTERLTAAEVEAAKAAALYRDALADRLTVMEANTKAKKADYDLTIAGLQLDLENAKQAGDKAKRLGDEAGLRAALIKQKEIELKIDKLKIESMKIEAEGSIALAQAKQAELAASNSLTPAKQIEIDTSIKLAQVKLKELEARGVNIKAREEELARIREGTQALGNEASALSQNSAAQLSNASAIDRNTSARERSISAREKEIALAAREKALEDKRRGVDSEGFTTGSDGKRVVAELPTWLSIFNQLKSRGLSDERAKAIAAEFTDGNGNVQFANNPGQIKYGKGTGMSLGAAVDAAAGEAIRTGRAGDSPVGAGGPVNRGGGGYTVNINLNGTRTSINTASKQDADALALLLQQLSRGASVAGG